MSVPTVIAVTGPTGHDVGPAAAFLGRNLGDGLAVRIVPDSRYNLAPHTSPNPYHHTPRTVELECLPSAWQNPDTNLGIVYATGGRDGGGEPGDELPNDLHTMDQLGLHPGHRLTVQVPGLRYAGQVPKPVEFVTDPHGLAEIARDSVLRGAGEHRTVLIEAGDGMLFLDAFAALGLPPWSTHIQHLELWTVLDLARIRDVSVGTFVDAFLIEHAAEAAATEVARQGGGAGGPDGTGLNGMYLALRNVHLLVPEVAGIGADGLNQAPEQGGRVPDAAAERLGEIVNGIERRAGARVGAISTGPGPAADGHEQWIDLDPR